MAIQAADSANLLKYLQLFYSQAGNWFLLINQRVREFLLLVWAMRTTPIPPLQIAIN